MSGMIAKAEILWISSDGTRTIITPSIGVPFPAEDGDWRCPVAIQCLHDQLPSIYGADALQSLGLALSFIGIQLRYLLKDGGRLFCPGTEDDFPLDAYFPVWRG